MIAPIVILLLVAVWMFVTQRREGSLGASSQGALGDRGEPVPLAGEAQGPGGEALRGAPLSAGAGAAGGGAAPARWDLPRVLLLVLLGVLPLMVFFTLSALGVAISPIFFWVFLVVSFLALLRLRAAAPARRRRTAGAGAAAAVPAETAMTLARRAEGVFAPRSVAAAGGAVVVEGTLLGNPQAAFRELASRFAGTGYLPMLQEDGAGRPVLLAIPDPSAGRKRGPAAFPWLNVVLLLLTVLTTTAAGAAHQGFNIWRDPGRMATGLPYALGIMAILGVHELGHYFTGRWHGIEVTLPYFIPVPFGLGTFGAFISMRSPAPNRRALFDVAVAGPLAGLAIAIPALLYGLRQSVVVSGPAEPGDMLHGGVEVGSSMLFALLAKISLGAQIAAGHQLRLHPLAFAGWLGLLVTALNLLPIGQLDGGHIAHALFGRTRAHAIGTAALFGLLLLGVFVWSGFLTWAFIVFFVAGTRDAPPLEDITPVDRGRAALGAFSFALLLLILAPVPRAFFAALGIQCPYL
jgi:membrane-associated protease RseP (regulator of RpoE activity)